MSTTRLNERVTQFGIAIERLKKALIQPENEFIRDSVIQRFEFTYELAWNAMKHYLATKDIDVRNAKDTLKEALAQGIITDGDGWGELHRYRNLTSHTYDEALAIEIHHHVKTTAIKLFEAAQHMLKEKCRTISG